MEGVLWKWTNYWNGWQPRWFVLDNGVLAYYKSQEEVNQGCKGSIKMSVCEIVVNPADNTRLDLVIPSEQHFYLKAATPQERQQWLVALGSAKASRMSARQKKDSTSSNPDMLKSKKSELRLYCDLLMQQVHTVKSASPDTNHSDTQTLTEATSLLGATCDTFIKTLEECMRLANANFPYALPHQLITDSSLPPALASSNAAFKKASRGPIYRSNSADRDILPNVHSKSSYRPRKNGMAEYKYSDPYSSDSSQMSDGDLATLVNPGGWKVPTSPGEPSTSSGFSGSVASSSAICEAEEDGGSDDDCVWTEASDNENNNRDLPPEPKEGKAVTDNVLETFFSNIKVSFLNLQVTDDDLIPTGHFLESCAIVITVFDMFGSPIFAPMKMDVMGNLKKITDKYNQDTEQFFALQNIVRQEMATDTTTARNSATDALLWLKRGLEFTYEFLMEFSRGNPDLKNCTLMAYNRTLKQYHGWIVRGVISAATRTVPSRNEVLGKLALHPDDMTNPKYEEALKADAKRFIKAMDRIITILNDFYQHHNLDKKEVV